MNMRFPLRMQLVGVVCAVILLRIHKVEADYTCFCNYNIETAVYPAPDTLSSAIGYLYEFDCKPAADDSDVGEFYVIQYEQQLAYLKKDPQIQAQTCQGTLPLSDKVTTTTTTTTTTTPKPTTTTTTTTSTPATTTPTTTTSTTRPTTSTTTTTTTPKPTTTTPKPTTTTTTPKPTTTTTTPKPTTTTTTPKPTTTTTTPKPTTTTTTPKPTTTTTPKPTTKTTTTSTTPKPTTTTTTPKPTTTTTTTPKPTTTTTTTPKPTTTTTTTPKPTTTTTTTTTPTPPTTTPTTTMPTTTPYDYWLHTANVEGTPYQYVGVGYNLLDGNPEVALDPGLLLNKRIAQLSGIPTDVKEATYTPYRSCIVNETLVHGSKSLQAEWKQLTRPSDSHLNVVTESSFLYDPDFMAARKTLDTGEVVYQDVVTSCVLSSVVYHTENVASQHFTVSRDFALAVCRLPVVMDATHMDTYFQFIDTWGTSVVIQADLGTMDIQRNTLKTPLLFNQVENQAYTVLDHEGELEGYSSSITIDTERYRQASINTDSRNAKTTTIGTPGNQTVVGLDLVPITDFIDWVYFSQVIDDLTSDGSCPSAMSAAEIQKVSANMKTALNKYPADRDARSSNHDSGPVVDYHLRIPVTWPLGTYGLMRSVRGCPDAKVTWSTGWRQQDNENTNTQNSHSDNIDLYLAGSFSEDIRTEYCMKTAVEGSKYDRQWPAGAYCILKQSSCPAGFNEGYLFWDDEDVSNKNKFGGSLPDGEYTQNTKIFYCCRNDGSTKTKVSLPTDRPFILLRYGSVCQQVYGMEVTDVFVRWDDDNSLNTSFGSGMHPDDEGGASDHLLHFCYYYSSGGSASLVG